MYSMIPGKIERKIITTITQEKLFLQREDFKEVSAVNKNCYPSNSTTTL